MQKLSNKCDNTSLNFTENRLKIGVIGFRGKLGSAILQAAQDLDTERLSAREIPDLIESKIWIYAGLSSSLVNWVKKALSLQARLVIGTTALSESDWKVMSDASKEIPVFYSPNFSLGMSLIKKFAKELAKKFYRNADIDLIETHHATKKDAPSGSALWIAKELEELGRSCEIHSLRTGKVVGIHTLQFNTDEEKITLSHEAHSRLSFGRGALEAAHFLQNQTKGLYGMEDLLEKALLKDNGAQ